MRLLTFTPMSSNGSIKYATVEQLGHALEELKAKVPSRWEVRALILGAIVVGNYDVPSEVTATAVIAGATGIAGKLLFTFFRAS